MSAITNEEIDELHTRFTEFFDHRLPDFLQSTTEDLAARILPILDREWPAQWRSQDRGRRGFQKRLRERWGSAIGRLRMFVAICQEFGESTTMAFRDRPEATQHHLMDVLARLHARACQLAEEVVCLLDAGLADGAMARWRTLHEIAVVALFLSEHGDALAEQYVNHQVVESLSAARDYQRCCDRLGYEPLRAAEMEELSAAFDEMVRRYGARFKDPVWLGS